MKQILVLAPNGQVGFELCRSLATLGNVVTLAREDIDFSDLTAVEAKVNELSPNVIVNAAAYTAVDKAEEEQQMADVINHQLPKSLAQIAKQKDIWLVHYSSDYVYPGTGTQPWTEESATTPLSVYGQSKLDGDNAIAENCDKHLIFRTSWVYAARRHNFMKTMLKLAQSRPDLKVVNDQIGAPTPARLIANVTAQALTQIALLENSCDSSKEQASKLAGVYHLAPRGEVSWFDFAKEIFSYARSQGVELQLDEAQFVGIPTTDYPTPAARPANSRLNVDKIEQAFNLVMPSWQSQLYLTMDEFLSD